MSDAAIETAREALDRLPDRRPASLYDVAYQYAIVDWYQTITGGDLDFDLDPVHLSFMTPMEKRDLYGEGDNALVVNVDLSDPDDPHLDEDTPVEFRTVDQGLRFELGHSYPANKTSSMTDYSVTTHKSASPWHLAGNRDDAWGTGNVQDRFTDWAQSEAAEAVIESGDRDAWIVEALAQLGDDEEAMQRLVDEFPRDPEDEESELEVFVTVRVRLPGEDRYLWPGEVPVLNEVMVRQKERRLESMNVDEPAAGDGTGYVTGEASRVTGGSVGLFGMYSKQQREHFANLSPSGEAAWRARPVAHETAAAIATANSVFEEFYRRLGESRRFYVLPYLGAHPETLTPENFAWYAENVFERLRSADDDFDEAVSEVFYQRESDDGAVGLFAEESADAYEWISVATVLLVSGNPDRVLFETTKTDQYLPRTIDVEHGRALGEPPFDGDRDGVFAGLADAVDSPLLSPDASRVGLVFFGGYFDWTTAPTRNSDQTDGRPRAGAIDDTRVERLRQILSGNGVPLAPLLEQYVHRLVQRQRTRFSESDSGVPGIETAEQYAQLRALDRAGALATDSSFATVTQTQDQTFESREERLEDFLESHDVLDDDARRAVFLLGGLVGRLSAYQRYNDVSSTLVRRYPIDYLTKQSIKEVTSEVLQMNNTYADAENQPMLNARYADQLPDLMLGSDPSEWSFPQNELQWLYALGIAYGNNDSSDLIENDD